jgi:hypothetical protein
MCPTHATVCMLPTRCSPMTGCVHGLLCRITAASALSARQTSADGIQAPAAWCQCVWAHGLQPVCWLAPTIIYMGRHRFGVVARSVRHTNQRTGKRWSCMEQQLHCLVFCAAAPLAVFCTLHKRGKQVLLTVRCASLELHTVFQKSLGSGCNRCCCVLQPPHASILGSVSMTALCRMAVQFTVTLHT